ncbi:MAG TPA: hypothetical protein PLU67_02560 [Candidatus Kapabacteria bacterium]|nr:hypothetical protein [Candidatus Kapabacteria bacterium]
MEFSREIMNKIAIRTIKLLHEQIERGYDADGNRYEYSTKPFARPAGGIVRFREFAKKAQKDGLLRYFTKKQSKWVVFTGGYKSFRALTGRNPNGDFLEYTGEMLSSLTHQINNNEITVSFSSRRAAEKAYYLNVTGAGKSRKFWKFMGLTDKNEGILADFAGEIFARNINILQDKDKIGVFKLQ